MRKAFKYRMYPSLSQTEALAAMLETHRRLYNSALKERQEVYESEKCSVSYREQSGKLKEARKYDRCLARTNFSSTQATLRRLDRAFKAFFRRLEAGEAAGYPRFKGRDRFRLVEFPSYGDGCRLKENRSATPRLYLQHVGHIKVKLHRPVEGKVKTVSLKKSCGKWYVIFVSDVGEAPEATVEKGPAVGIDLGLTSFFATSKGEMVEPSRYYRRSQKKRRRAQRSVSRKKKGSNRRCKARERVAKLHEKTANQRRDFHHKRARKLVDTYGLIAHESLNVKGIARSHLAKTTHDAGWLNSSKYSSTKRKRLVPESSRLTPGTPRKPVAGVARFQRSRKRFPRGCMPALHAGTQLTVTLMPLGTYSGSDGAFRTKRSGLPHTCPEKLPTLAGRVVTLYEITGNVRFFFFLRPSAALRLPDS